MQEPQNQASTTDPLANLRAGLSEPSKFADLAADLCKPAYDDHPDGPCTT